MTMGYRRRRASVRHKQMSPTTGRIIVGVGGLGCMGLSAMLAQADVPVAPWVLGAFALYFLIPAVFFRRLFE